MKSRDRVGQKFPAVRVSRSQQPMQHPDKKVLPDMNTTTLDDDPRNHSALPQDKFQLETFQPILSFVPQSGKTTEGELWAEGTRRGSQTTFSGKWDVQKGR